MAVWVRELLNTLKQKTNLKHNKVKAVSCFLGMSIVHIYTVHQKSAATHFS